MPEDTTPQGSQTPRGDAPPPRPSLIDAAADLLQTFVDWLRTEAEDLVREKIVLPLQKLGVTLASASAAGCLLAFGLAFISVGLLILLAKWLTWPGALISIGAVLCIGAAVFTYLKVRSMQHELPAGSRTGRDDADAPGTPPRDPRRSSQEG